MYITTTGLVLREVLYKESSKILTVLTASLGKITVLAKGARRKGSKISASCQLLVCSEMTLFCSKGKYTLTEGRCLEDFSGLRDDIELLALGSYFAEMMETVCGYETPEPEMLSLGLNALFALTEGKRPQKLIKTAFEIRLMCLAGFEPMAFTCVICGKEEVPNPYLNLEGGTVCCEKCKGSDMGRYIPMCQGSLAAMRYIISAEPKKVFSFKLGEESLYRLGKISESYVKKHLDRDFKTLEFYKSVHIN